MEFGNPSLLWILTLWPALAWWGWWSLRRRERLAQRIGSPALLDRLYPASIRRWRAQRVILVLAAALLLMIASARPQYGRVEQTIHSYGTNVLVALDCSPSMKARDVAPNRMEQAKKSLGWLLQRLKGNRVGIIGFAGVAFLHCPMTIDHRMALAILDSLDTDSVGVPGTDLGAAIRLAVEAFERGAPAGSRALVLITDGEDNEHRAEEAAREAAAKDIRIYAIGIGTELGAPLIQEKGGFKEDRSGAKVNTQLRMDTLESIAKLTDGKAFAAGAAPARVVDAVDWLIQNQEKSEQESHRQFVYQDRFQWFLAPALALLIWLLLSRPEPTDLQPSRLAEETSS